MEDLVMETDFIVLLSKNLHFLGDLLEDLLYK